MPSLEPPPACDATPELEAFAASSAPAAIAGLDKDALLLAVRATIGRPHAPQGGGRRRRKPTPPPARA